MTNVKLSVAEIELMQNASIILTKNRIIQQVYQLFGNLSESYQQTINEHSYLPQEVIAIAPKISKGENYEGLPWVCLDYPRYFTQNHVFAVRTFFWWGNFCSITLQLKGSYLNNINVQQLFQECADWYLCCNTNEWEHHFRADNYLPITQFSAEQIQRLSFIKLAKKIPLQEWDDIDNFFNQHFRKLFQALASQTVK